MAVFRAIMSLLLLAFAIGASGFPSLFKSSLAAQKATLQGETPCPYSELRKRQAGGAVPGVNLPFDPIAQKISTTGDHAWIAPGPNDLRGNCPGLNVLANHGYLPRSGYASLTQYIQAVNDVFGMSPDLGGFLSAFGTVSAGDPTNIPPSWSMGGRPSDAQVGLNLIGTAFVQRGTGINNAHNTYEGDGSVSRGDYYQFNGDSYSLRLPFFKELYFRKTSDPNFSYDTPTLMAHCNTRTQESVSQNPYYFTANFAGFVASRAAYFFTSRLMANFSAEHNVDGLLTPAILKSFYAISGPDNNLKWTPGYERIPNNWYRRPLALGYGQAGVFTDLPTMWRLYPETGKFGGNTGTVNSFAGLDIADLTDGVYNAEDLLDPVKLQCFVLQLVQITSLPFLAAKGLVNALTGQATDTILTPLLADKFSQLACPQLRGLKNVLFDQFPGKTIPSK